MNEPDTSYEPGDSDGPGSSDEWSDETGDDLEGASDVGVDESNAQLAGEAASAA